MRQAKKPADEDDRFNTASGMDCMQSRAVAAFEDKIGSFNTASGMDCMQ